MKVLILSPGYDPSSGGIRVLHYFAYLAHRSGNHNVKLTCNVFNPDWGNYSHEFGPDHDIAILPEIYPPAITLKNPVRWVLYYPGQLCGGPVFYPPHETVVSYHPDYTQSAKDAASGRDVMEFYLPYSDMSGVNPDEFKPIPGIVWYGKHPIVPCPEIAGLSVINRSWPSPRANLITVLNKTRTFYSFDKCTSLNNEALLCGCNVLLWNGTEFKKYEHDNPSVNIMNVERDQESVNDFLAKLKNNFGII